MGFGFGGGGMALTTVNDGSPAAAAGLKAVLGWWLVEVEGKKVTSMADCAGHQHSMALRMLFRPPGAGS
eukprot:gene48321-48287_t